MQKIIKIDDKVIVMFEDGSYLEKTNISEELFKQIVESDNEEEIFFLMCPEYSEIKQMHDNILSLLDKVKESKILTLVGESVYWEDISKLSMPLELVKAIIKAEEENNEDKLISYKNFWTLMCLNPDSECRKNLFWFLNRNGLTISKQGFFVAYRNVDTTNTPYIYTDYFSHTFKIKIGEMVTMPRKDCDCRVEQECSRGLVCSPVY